MVAQSDIYLVKGINMITKKHCSKCEEATEHNKKGDSWICSVCGQYHISLTKEFQSKYSHTPHRKHRY